MSYDAPNHNHTNIFSHLICHFSDLEKAAKEIAPKEDLIDPKILYPAFAASMIANILMGGHILSQVTMWRNNFTSQINLCKVVLVETVHLITWLLG